MLHSVEGLLTGDFHPLDESLLPQFGKEETNLESLRLNKINETLRSEGALDIEELFGKFDGGFQVNPISFFGSVAELHTFVNNRRFLFSYDIFSQKVRNLHTYERDMCFRLNHNIYAHANKWPLKEAFTWLSRLYFDQSAGAKSFLGWLNVKSPEGLLDFFAAFPELYVVKGDRVSLVDSAVSGIPSLLRPLLPYPQQDNTRSGTGIIWESSIVFSFIGYISSSTDTYAKAIIIGGPHTKKTVYILGKNVNRSGEQMGNVFPVGSMVELRAHVTYFAKNDFSAIEIRQQKSGRDFWKVKNRELVIFDKTSPPCVSSLLSPPPPHNITHQMTGSSIHSHSSLSGSIEAPHRRFIPSIINVERLRQRRVDDVLGGNAVKDEEVVTAVVGPYLFELSSDVVSFILHRPHLYKIDGPLVCRRAPEETTALLKLFNHIYMNKPLGLPRMKLKTELKQGACGDALQQVAIDDANFAAMLEEMNSVLVEWCDTDGVTRSERYIALNGSIIGAFFIPKLDLA